MTDIFFSYSREDKDRVAFIAAALEAEGYDLWWDTDIAPGETYRGVTQAKLRAAKCVVVVWSQTSVNSRWVIGEAEEGLHRDILLPIMIDDIVRDIPIDFRSVQVANLTRWKGERSDHEWKKVLASVKRFVEQPAKPTQTYRKPKRSSTSGGRAMTALALFLGIMLSGIGFLYWSATQSPEQIAAREEPPQEKTLSRAGSDEDATQDSATVFITPSGSFRKEGDRWVEYPPYAEGQHNTFEEIARDNEYIYLKDARRTKAGEPGNHMLVRIPINGGEVQWSYENPIVWTSFSVARPEVEKPEPSAPAFTVTATSGTRYTTGEANVRAGPGVEYDVVTRLDANAEVTLTGKVDGMNWYRVRGTGGAEAYVSGNLLTDSPPSTGPDIGEKFRDCTDCPDMVVVPAGSFRMGDLNGGFDVDEKPVHTVTIAEPFAVGRFEVTWAEWEACIRDGGCSNSGPDGDGGDKGWGKGKRPVINVSWEDVQSYIGWLSRKTSKNYRLLSEVEWEYVTRAGSTTKYHFGNSESSLCRYANGADISSNYSGRNTSCSDGYGEQTAPVGSFQPNAFGIYDMHGNVWEWVQDCWNDSYAGAPSSGRAWEAGDCSRRVLRGGSLNNRPRDLRSAIRNWSYLSKRGAVAGFRVSRTLD